MVYRDEYDDIDHFMSDSNIGARKKRNVRNHLFVVYGIINSVVHGESGCVDIQIYDLVQAFDALWVDECLNDVYDALPDAKRDDKLALLYEINKHNKVAVNTAVGQTERFPINKVVTQGSTWGSLLCSNHIDSLGRRSRDTGDHMYSYKKQVDVLPLAMVDDLLGIAECGHDSLALNTFINTQIEMKKLQFHTPDEKGKSKCNVMHVGKKSDICPQLQVHGTVMKKISHDTYLGDIISCDGTNDLNILNRVSKGHGKITQIMNMLDRVTLGSHYFRIALMLRESLFLNSILTNAEAWYGLSNKQVDQLEMVDRILLRNCLDTPVSTPVEALYLELGIFRIGTIIKARRINFLHTLLSTSEKEMTYKVLLAQWNHPVKQDWTEQVREDLSEFRIEPNLDSLKNKSSNAFKKFVKIKASEYEFRKLMELKQKHSKMDSLSYSRLEMQNYLKLENCDARGARTVFKYRTRMALYGENFRQNDTPVSCPLCDQHLDNQAMGFNNCQVTKINVQIQGLYTDLFKQNVPKILVKTLQQIDDFRKENIET